VIKKQTPPKTEAEEVQGRKCYSCDKPDSETVLFTIILPPVILEKQDLCPPCLAVAIDFLKRKVKWHNDNQGPAADCIMVSR
jgi:hypothetical protein